MAGRFRKPTAVLKADGRMSQVDVIVGGAGCPRQAPIVVGAAFDGYNQAAKLAAKDLPDLFRWINNTDSGAWVGTGGVEVMRLSKRPVGFIQSNTSRFYNDGHPSGGSGSSSVWRDFYFQTVFAVVDGLDSEFRCEDIEIIHPTLEADHWSPSMQATVLDALGHLAETRRLSLKRVHLSCPHGMSDETLKSAAMELNREQTATQPPRLREPHVIEVPPASLGISGCDGVRLLKIDLIGGQELLQEGGAG